jgi:DAACS family dicarboxylate/amino acid:cation (Na+ or H+) symporter
LEAFDHEIYTAMREKKHAALTFFILLAMALGMATGVLLGQQIAGLGIVGTLFIKIIKVVAIPLVFFSIVDAVLSTDLSWVTARKWMRVILLNSTFALAIGLTLSNLLEPGKNAGLLGQESIPTHHITHEFTVESFLQTIIPDSILTPFIENNVLGVVLLALLLGTATRTFLHTQGDTSLAASVCKVTSLLNGIVTQLILWLVMLVPFAVFCVTAKTVGEFGFAPFRGLINYVGIAVLGFIIHVLCVYSFWIVRIANIPIRVFLSIAHKPVAYAFGTNSSLATLPITLEALDTLKIKKSASRLGACVGTNFNNDGILLYEAVAVLFVAQAYGIELSLQQQLVAALISLAAAIGVAGIPEAGVVSLSLVLAAVGLPVEIVPLLLSVDWLVARLRSVVNVLSDMTVSVAVSRLT